jgi:hypothetical protein
MKNRRNYYRILHVQPDAPPDIVKASYRTQMQKLRMHPDLGGDEWDASILNEAYRVLSNPEQRAAYDAAFLGDREGLFQAAQSSGNRTGQDEYTGETAAADLSLCAFCRTPRPPNISELPVPVCSGCAAPLQAANTMRAVGPAKRACERMTYHAPVTVYLDTECTGLQGILRDLSPMGLQLQTHNQLRAGQIIRLSSEVVTAIGRVIFCNRTRNTGQFTIGIAFITVHFRQQSGTFICEQA